MSNALTKALIGGLYLLLLTPLLYHPASLYPFLALKIVFFQALVEILAAIYLTLAFFDPRYRPKLGPIFVTFSLFILTLFLSGWWGVDWRTSFWSFPERGIGTFALVHFWLFFLMLSGMARQINWRQLFTTSFVASLVLSLLTLVFFWQWRPGGLLGNPNFLSAYLLFHVFIGFWLGQEFWQEKKKKLAWLFWAGVIFEVLMIFITQTQGVILGLMGGWLFLILSWIYKTYKSDKPYRSYIFILLTSLFVLTGAIFIFRQSIPVVNKLADPSPYSLLPRLNAWRAGWQGFLEKPLLGWGWDNFDKVVNQYYNPADWYRIGEAFFSKPHNIYIEYLVSGGLLAMAAFLLFVVGYFNYASTVFQALMIGHLAQSFFSFDAFGTYLMLIVVVAFVQATKLRNGYEYYKSREIKFKKLTALIILLGLTSIPMYFVNHRFWLADFLASRGKWERAAKVTGPYQGFAIKNYVLALQQNVNENNWPLLKDKINLAMAGLEKAIEKRPKDYFLRTVYGEAATAFAKFDNVFLKRAKKHLAISRQISPKRYQSHYLLAKIKMIEGDYESMKKIMMETIASNPNLGESHFFFGIFLLQSNDVKRGLAELDLAKKLGREPIDNAEAKLVAGYYGDAGRFQDAIYNYDRALVYNPDDSESLLKKGLVYYYNRDLKNSEKTFKLLFDKDTSFKNTSDYEKVSPVLKQLGL